MGKNHGEKISVREGDGTWHRCRYTRAMGAEFILVDSEVVRPLRGEVLRPGQELSESIYPQDDDPSTTHFAMKEDEEIIGVVSLLPEIRSGGMERWRVRGMAVRPDRQREGLGSILMRGVQAIAQKRGGGMWMNVRTTAESFYSGHGCQVEGEPFEGDLIGSLGSHILMVWWPDGEKPASPDAES
ncbi:MAG: GNAT family N-acetyltransferase [Planctomycetota bacterium]|nr:GNAT family N-acetyltransferase [Planctomycetota bacterium]